MLCGHGSTIPQVAQSSSTPAKWGLYATETLRSNVKPRWGMSTSCDLKRRFVLGRPPCEPKVILSWVSCMCSVCSRMFPYVTSIHAHIASCTPTATASSTYRQAGRGAGQPGLRRAPLNVRRSSAHRKRPSLGTLRERGALSRAGGFGSQHGFSPQKTAPPPTSGEGRVPRERASDVQSERTAFIPSIRSRAIRSQSPIHGTTAFGP